MTNRGHTLLELAVVLSILALLGAAGLGHVRQWADHLAVRAEREAVAALFHRARTEARLAGGSTVRVDPDAGEVLVRVGADSVVARHGVRRAGVRLEIEGVREEADIRFGPLGTGRAASLTLTLSRGGAEARVVVSSYGRVRR